MSVHEQTGKVLEYSAISHVGVVAGGSSLPPDTSGYCCYSGICTRTAAREEAYSCDCNNGLGPVSGQAESDNGFLYCDDRHLPAPYGGDGWYGSRIPTTTAPASCNPVAGGRNTNEPCDSSTQLPVNKVKMPLIGLINEGYSNVTDLPWNRMCPNTFKVGPVSEDDIFSCIKNIDGQVPSSSSSLPALYTSGVNSSGSMLYDCTAEGCQQTPTWGSYTIKKDDECYNIIPKLCGFNGDGLSTPSAICNGAGQFGVCATMDTSVGQTIWYDCTKTWDHCPK